MVLSWVVLLAFFGLFATILYSMLSGQKGTIDMEGGILLGIIEFLLGCLLFAIPYNMIHITSRAKSQLKMKPALISAPQMRSIRRYMPSRPDATNGRMMFLTCSIWIAKARKTPETMRSYVCGGLIDGLQIPNRRSCSGNARRPI